MRRSLFLVALALATAGCVGRPPPPTPHPPGPTPNATALPAPTATATATPSPTTIRLVSLGDSTLTGYLCDCDGPVAALASRLAATHPHATVTTTELAVNGSTSSDLLDLLRGDEDARDAVAAADVVVIASGANDLLSDQETRGDAGCDAACYGPDAAAAADRVGAALAEVRSLRRGRSSGVVVAGYWNVFEDGRVGLALRGADEVRWSVGVTTALNAGLRRAASDQGVGYVDLVRPFKGPRGDGDPTALLADDGDHPNARGVEVMADALAAALS